jgi:hypothetical protein
MEEGSKGITNRESESESQDAGYKSLERRLSAIDNTSLNITTHHGIFLR